MVSVVSRRNGLKGLRRVSARDRARIRRSVTRRFGWEHPTGEFEVDGKLYVLNCWWCGLDLTPTSLTLDHRLPTKLGGGNEVTNFIPSCYDCNQDRGHELEEDYRARKAAG